MADQNERVRDHCNTCSEVLDRKDDFHLPEDNVLLIDLDVEVVNIPPGDFNKKERKDKRKNFVDELKKYVSALRNTTGGVVLVHLQRLAVEDKCLDTFNELVDVKLNDMIEDGSLFVQSYQKDWLLDNESNGENIRFQGFVAIHVTGSRVVTTVDFKSKQPLDNSVIDVQSNEAIQFLKRKNCFEDKRASIRGIPQFNERRNIQLKSFDTAKEDTLQSVGTFNDFLWNDCRLGGYVSAFSKIDGGGSFFLGINETVRAHDTYKTKTFSTAGIGFRDLNFQETDEAIFQSLQDNTVIVTYSGERLETPRNTIEVVFHPVEADKFVLEVAVAAVDGLLFYDREGPEAYEYENENENDGLRRLTITEWYESRPPYCLSRLMAMLKANLELSEKDGKNCLHENLTNLPVQMVDTRGLYQRRTPCMQIERSLENIEAMVLQEDEDLGPETIKLFPKSFPEKETYANLKSRLNELSAADNVGLAYIAKSLPVTANMVIKYKTPGEVIMDVCLIRQRSPTVILSVVTDMSENMKLTQRYNSALSKELTKNVRKFTTVTFNSIYGLVHEKELMSKDTFESSLARIEKERSRLCVPDSLSMNKEKYKHVVRAFLSSMAATEFVSGKDDETLWFLTHKQFCILTENIDHSEVHVDTFPASGGRVLSLTVCQRLQKLGRTLLISDDDTLIKRARNHDIDCKNFSDLEQRDLAAEGKAFYVVICEGGEHSSSQVPHLPLLLEAGQKRWVFHIQKSSEMEENPAYCTSMEAWKSSSSKSEDPVPFVKAEMQDNPVYWTSDNATEASTPQLKDKDVQVDPFYRPKEPSSTNHPTHVKAEGSSFLDREIRMVLVGKTGVGKSATGNTIIRAGKRAQLCQALMSTMSATTKCKQHSFKRFEYDLQLVDVPGFCDTSRTDEDNNYEVMRCVGSCFLDREIRMVLVGKTGVGKSATGNTIIGAGKGAQIFKASVTKKCKQHSFKRFGYDLQLVDVPGFCDTSRSEEDIKQEVMKCVCMSSPGIHAILFIVRTGRFTEEDKNTLEKFLQCFGKEAERFVIVVFTGKDNLEESGNLIDNYLGDIAIRLKQFLFHTSFIAVDNRGTDEEKEKFTKDLIDMVRDMVDRNGGECYTNEMYERCEADLREAEKIEKLEEKGQMLLADKLKIEVSPLEEELKRWRIEMQEMVKQFEKKRKERDEAEQLRRQLKAVELRQKEEEEKKRLDEDKKLQAERNEALENRRRELLRRREEELRPEQTRKQIREKVEDGDTSYLFHKQCFGEW